MEQNFNLKLCKEEGGLVEKVEIETQDFRALLRLEALCRSFDVGTTSSSGRIEETTVYLKKGLMYTTPFTDDRAISTVFTCWMHGLLYPGTGESFPLENNLQLINEGDWYVFVSPFMEELSEIENACVLNNLAYVFLSPGHIDSLYHIELSLWQRTEEQKRLVLDLLTAKMSLEIRQQWYKKGHL